MHPEFGNEYRCPWSVLPVKRSSVSLQLAVIAATMLIGISACGENSESLSSADGTSGASYPADLVFVRGGKSGGIFVRTDSGEFHLGDGASVTVPQNVRRIAFTRGRGEMNKRICIADVGKMTLTNERCNIAGTDPAWNADGTKLAYVRDGVWLMTYPDEKAERIAGPEYEGDLAWSPDGTNLLIRRSAAPVAVLDVRTQEVDELEDPRTSLSATWHPVTGELTLAVRTLEGGSAIYLRQWPGAIDRKLFDVDGSVGEMSWSSDGRYLAYTFEPLPTSTDVVDELGREDIHVFNLDMDEDRPMTRNDVADFDPVWLPKE